MKNKETKKLKTIVILPVAKKLKLPGTIRNVYTYRFIAILLFYYSFIAYFQILNYSDTIYTTRSIFPSF